VHEIGAFVPLAFVALIAFLVIRARISGPGRPAARFSGPGRPATRWSFPRLALPRKKRKLKLVPFDPAKMDDELAQLLRKRR
jgi:hypothetical protein